jgi:hypothetical protein
LEDLLNSELPRRSIPARMLLLLILLNLRLRLRHWRRLIGGFLCLRTFALALFAFAVTLDILASCYAYLSSRLLLRRRLIK